MGQGMNGERSDVEIYSTRNDFKLKRPCLPLTRITFNPASSRTAVRVLCAALGAQCGVINNIAAGDFVLGSPAIPQREFMKQQASMKKLPDGIRTLRQLEKQVRALQEQLDEIKAASPQEFVETE